MAGIYRQRHPEHTVFYRVFFYYFERFLREYESRFEKEYGYFRPVIQDVVERYLHCGNPMCGFARIRCPDCGEERLQMFSCKTRGFYPSCHAKRREEWTEWKILGWRHTGFNIHSKVRTKTRSAAERVGKYMIRPLLSLKRLLFDEKAGRVRYQYSKDGSREESMDYLEFIARVTSHIPDKGQVMIRYYGLYSNAHRGKLRKARAQPSHPPIIDDDTTYMPSKGWAEMIRKAYEIYPLLCPSCGGKMSIISFIDDHKVIDRIIGHLEISFQAARPPPPHHVQQELLMAAEEKGEYF
jgi:hypothetical protein